MNEFLVALDQWFTVDRTLMLAYIFACAVQSMPGPEGAGKVYRFLYGFAHTLAGNIALVRKELKNGKTTTNDAQ